MMAGDDRGTYERNDLRRRQPRDGDGGVAARLRRPGRTRSVEQHGARRRWSRRSRAARTPPVRVGRTAHADDRRRRDQGREGLAGPRRTGQRRAFEGARRARDHRAARVPDVLARPLRRQLRPRGAVRGRPRVEPCDGRVLRRRRAPQARWLPAVPRPGDGRRRARRGVGRWHRRHLAVVGGARGLLARTRQVRPGVGSPRRCRRAVRAPRRWRQAAAQAVPQQRAAPSVGLARRR